MSTEHMWTLSRADGDRMGGDEYEFWSASGPDDWEYAVDEMVGADEDEEAEPVEFVIEEWVKVRSHRRVIAPIPSKVDRDNYRRGRNWRDLLDEYTVTP